MKGTTLILVVLLPLLFFQGCAGRPPSVPKAEVRTALEIPPGMDARPVQLTKMAVRMRRGETIGELSFGTFCRHIGTVTWRAVGDAIDENEFREAFLDELKKANYPVVGDPRVLFEDPALAKAELHVAALVNKLEANVCRARLPGDRAFGAKGGAFVQVNWQVYVPFEKRTAYEATTRGSYETDELVRGGTAAFVANAFGAAVRNLLADPEFRRLVLRPKAEAGLTTEPSFVPLSMTAAPRPTQEIGDARAAVVTVIVPDAHGSGFIISPSGYVLTNYHVVEAARFVKVRLANKRDTLGDVVRTDPVRDVALVKLREANLPSLALRLATSPNVGDEVYAIGTPKDRALDLTVTKGIVSAYRDNEGKSSSRATCRSTAGIRAARSWTRMDK
jgi:hypothetical protein